MIVRGAPAIGQVAAIGLALTGWITRSVAAPRAAARSSRARQTCFRARGPPRSTCAGRWIGCMARYHDIGAFRPDGEAIAAALHDEAMAIVAEATDDHGRLAEAGLAILPEPADRPLRVLTHCNTGPAGLRPVRDGARRRAGRPRRGATAPRLGGRDAAVPPGRPSRRHGSCSRRACRIRSCRTWPPVR